MRLTLLFGLLSRWWVRGDKSPPLRNFNFSLDVIKIAVELNLSFHPHNQTFGWPMGFTKSGQAAIWALETKADRPLTTQ